MNSEKQLKAPKKSVEIVDELSPQEKLSADLSATKDPDTRALIILRNTLEMATGIMNGDSLPDNTHEEAVILTQKIEHALSGSNEKQSALKEAQIKITEWLKDEDLDEVGVEMRGVLKIINRSPALQTTPMGSTLTRDN